MSELGGLELTATELRTALDDGALVAVYQPCHDLRTGALVAVEALARLRDPETGELVTPARFMAAAEASGQVTRLDLLMIDQAFRQVAQWRSTPAGRDLCVAVNLSPVDLDDPQIAERIGRAAASAGLPLEAVIVELTETVLAEAGRGHDAALAAISELGCNVTLDDFGTGNASFAYLQRFQVNGLKIDRSFVHMLGTGGPGQRVAESLVRFCLALNVHVVAEGIEEQSQVTALSRLGCHLGQGFLLGKPMTAEQLDDVLREGRTRAAVLTPEPGPRQVPLAAPRPQGGGGRSSVLAALVVLLIAFLTVMTVLSQSHAEESLRASAHDRLATIDSLAAGEVNEGVTLVREALAASERPAVRAALERRDVEQMTEEAARIMSTPAEVYSAGLYDASGTMLASRPAPARLIGQNFAHRDWYAGARNIRGVYTSSAYRLKTPEAPWAVGVAVALRDESGNVSGFVVATYALDRVQGKLATVLAPHGVTATLVDGRGTVLAAPDGDGIGQPVTDPRLQAPTARKGEAGDRQWVIKPVPAIGGWLLTEQSVSETLGLATPARWLLSVLVVLLAGGGIALVILWVRADRRRRRLEDDLAEAHGWLSTVLAATPTPLVVCDASGRVQTANAAMADLLGTTPPQLQGADLGAWLPLEGQARDESGVVSTSVMAADGETRSVEVRSQLLGDPHGQPMQLHTVVDVTPHREERDRLRAQGRTDPLTGVGNRRALREAMADALADPRSAYALVMMDLDRFKPVNDTLGHAVGDDLLCAVARALRDASRPGDTVTRVGGDEFVTLVRFADAAPSPAVAERLQEEVAAALDAHPAARTVGVGVSTGTAIVGADGTDLDDLLFVADQRMYAVKRAHRAAAAAR